METRYSRTIHLNKQLTSDTLLAEKRRKASSARHEAIHIAEELAAGRLFKAVVWGYFGSAVGMLALTLSSVLGVHIPWIHLGRGIVTGI